MKTEYRSVGDGYCRWLEYRKTIRVLWIKITYWVRVPSDHWDEWMHEGISCLDHNRFVNSYDYDLSWFVDKYPSITDWLIERNATINRKWQAIENKKQIRLNKNSGVKKLK